MIVRGAAVLALSLALSIVSAEAKDMTAEWAGAYGYEDGRPAVFFSLNVSQNGKIITGHLREVQTFGSQTSDNALKAKIVGSVDGHVVAFTKTYDGSGGQSHSVNYRGTLFVDGGAMFMFGTWHLGSDVGSWFATVAD
jgi:hypothetical protein